MFPTERVGNKPRRNKRDFCRNPLKSGQCFLPKLIVITLLVMGLMRSRNPLKSGQCFLLQGLSFAEIGKILGIHVAIPSNRVNVSYEAEVDANKVTVGKVAIPSNRVNVSYSTHLFLRIIGNLTPLLREPHYFYAFLFPI